MLKKLIGLGVAFMLVLGVTTGTSWAYFRDTETSTGNTITAGTLDLVPLESGSYTGGSPSLYVVTPGGNGINGNVVFDKMAPGQSGTIEWVLHNTGSLSGTLTTSLSGVFALAASPGEPKTLVPGYFANPNGYLGTYVMVTLQKGVGANQAAAESALATGYINAGHNTTDSTPYAISGMGALWNADSQAMTASGGSTGYVVYLFSWYLTSAVLGPTLWANIDIVQGDTAQLDITYTLNQ